MFGERGLTTCRRILTDVEASLAPRGEDLWGSPDRGQWFTIEWNAHRLAVLDLDADAIIRTHARDMKVARWLKETSQALEEIGQIDLAIEWAHRSTQHSPSD